MKRVAAVHMSRGWRTPVRSTPAEQLAAIEGLAVTEFAA
jgi:hypothetical protein